MTWSRIQPQAARSEPEIMMRWSTLAKIARSMSNWKRRPASSACTIRWQPLLRQSSSNTRAGPIWRTSAPSSPSSLPGWAASTMICSEKRQADCTSRSRAPVSWRWSRRPSVAMTRWRTFLPSRWFSTIWMYVLGPLTLARQNMGLLRQDTTYRALVLRGYQEKVDDSTVFSVLSVAPHILLSDHRVGPKGAEFCGFFRRRSPNQSPNCRR